MPHNDSWGDTHVTVWRSEDDNYHVVSDIILTPDNKTTDGPRFQYVHNEVMRVKQGDYIGVYATGDGGRNIVSMSSNDPTEKLVKILNEDIYQGQQSLTKGGFSDGGKRDVSLRAFVAGKHSIYHW